MFGKYLWKLGHKSSNPEARVRKRRRRRERRRRKKE
jgi:hypothetical protein